MKVSRIYLAGFMTSGKSTIGPILANVLGWNFYDLDNEIEKQEKKTVVEIFETKGENYFRHIEKQILEKLSSSDNVIISLGGGTIVNQENLNLVQKTGKLIYLKVSAEILQKRLSNKINRPLFKDLVLSENTGDEFVEKIENLLAQRSPYYERADYTFRTDDYRIGATVDAIANKIRQLINEKD